MSLESQLRARADRIFHENTSEVYGAVVDNLKKLGFEKPPTFEQYCERVFDGKAGLARAKEKHREKFIQEFIQKVEDVQGMLE